MKSEYDFSRGERGRFYDSEVVFNYPVYLEPDVEAFMSQKATELHIEVQDLVNEWLRVNIELVRTYGGRQSVGTD